MTRLTQYASRITHYVSRFTQHDLAMIMLAMLMMRLLSVITLRVGGYIAETGPDSAYHFQLGRLAAGGAYPFVNYWVEYPPFFPWLSVLAYKISALMPSWIDQRFWFNLALHGLIIPFDIANVVLIYHLSKRVNGEGLADQECVVVCHSLRAAVRRVGLVRIDRVVLHAAGAVGHPL